MMKACLFLLRLVAILGLIVLTTGSYDWTPSLAASPETRSPVSSSSLANIRGEVTTQNGAFHLGGARVRIPALNLDTITNASGQFSWTNISIYTNPDPADVRVTAPGYGEWVLKNALVRRDDTLILNIDLRESPTILNAPGAYSSVSQTATAVLFSNNLQSSTQFNEPLPATIRVGMTGNILCTPFITTTYSVRTVDFKSYVKHVLPNEWLHTWGRESLRAGAVAVKMYAWFWIELGGKWRGTDMIDSTCDQVYNPAVEYASTNEAVDFTWNWKLTRQGEIFQTFHKNVENCDPPTCMNQSDSEGMAVHGYSWDEILAHFYPGSVLSQINPGINAYMLRFNGTPGDGPLSNHVEFPLIDPRQPDNSLPINVGSGDFTIEWWMKTAEGDNNSSTISCGDNQSWNQGNIIFDRSKSGSGGQYGVSLAKNRLAFGITSPSGKSLTLCGANLIVDNQWHHIAIQRRRNDGVVWMFVDGKLDGFAASPQGDISYTPGSSSYAIFDPVLFLGGGKIYDDSLPHPFYRGWIDELRFSSILRYPTRGSFQPPSGPFAPDGYTLALYHFDDGLGSTILDSSGVSAHPTNGRRFYGGSLAGPEWMPGSLFITYTQNIPFIFKP